MVKNLPANTGGSRDTSSIPGSGRSPGGGNGNPLQYACLENSMDRGAWHVTVRGVTKGQTGLSDFTSLHFSIFRVVQSLPLFNFRTFSSA